MGSRQGFYSQKDQSWSWYLVLQTDVFPLTYSDTLWFGLSIIVRYLLQQTLYVKTVKVAVILLQLVSLHTYCLQLQLATHPNKEIADCSAAKVGVRSDGGSDIALSASEMMDRKVAEGDCFCGDHPACHMRISLFL